MADFSQYQALAIAVRPSSVGFQSTSDGARWRNRAPAQSRLMSRGCSALVGAALNAPTTDGGLTR